MAEVIHARCHNCKWTFTGPRDLFGKDDQKLLGALRRDHYENQPGPVNKSSKCGCPNIIIDEIPTYYCLLCGRSTILPHVCLVFM
jgi:hypothetical protein